MEKKNNNKQRHRKFDAQFKQEALKQVENGRSVATVAQGLGISEALLYQWRKRLAPNFSARQNSEVELLRKQLKQVETERDILKKALAIFSRPI